MYVLLYQETRSQRHAPFGSFGFKKVELQKGHFQIIFGIKPCIDQDFDRGHFWAHLMVHHMRR